MKRALAATVVLVCAAVSPLSGQVPDGKSSVSEAKRQFLQAEERAGAVIRDAAIEDFLDAVDEDRSSLRDKLRPVLEESFDARQRLQRAELDTLRRRLTEIEQAIAARENSKAAIVNARLDSLLLSTNGAAATMQNVQNAGVKPKSYVSGNQQPREVAEAADKITSDDQFDLETREQLAQIDLQEAQAEYDAAEKQMRQSQRLHESGAVPHSQISAHERNLRRAKAELDRAKVKVEGVARQRESDAEAAVANAEGQLNMAVGNVSAKEGNRDAARERLQKAEADLKAATTKRNYEAKDVERVQKLVDTGAAEANLLEEHKNNLSAAEAELSATVSATKAANAYLKDTERQLEEARAIVHDAEAKVGEAQAQLDRLLHRSAPKPPADADPKPVKETQP